MIAAASRSFCTGTGQGEGKRESPASKRAPGFLRIMRPVSEEPSAPLSHRVPRTSQSPKGRPVCQDPHHRKDNSLIPAPFPEPGEKRGSGSAGKQPEPPAVSLMESAGSFLRREEERPVHPPEPVPAPRIHHDELKMKGQRDGSQFLSPRNIQSHSTCRGAVSQYPPRDFHGIS